MRLITWQFSNINSKALAISEHVFVEQGKWDGLMFSVSGLGLRKFERDIFSSGFLEIKNIVNVYLGRVVISFDKRGFVEHYRSVKVINTQSLKKVLRDKFMSVVQCAKEAAINKYHEFMNSRQFKTVYDFEIVTSYDGPYTFRSDMLSAFQLASNYESDLLLNGRYMLSPLGLDDEDNLALVKKHLGKRFIVENGYNLRGYKRKDSPGIEFFELKNR